MQRYTLLLYTTTVLYIFLIYFLQKPASPGMKYGLLQGFSVSLNTGLHTDNKPRHCALAGYRACLQVLHDGRRHRELRGIALRAERVTAP